MTNQLAIAIHIPHACSLTSELLSIPTHNYHAAININQVIHLAQIKSKLDFTPHSDTHPDLVIANLTDLTLFPETFTNQNNDKLNMTERIIIIAANVAISTFLWLAALAILFFKGFTRP